LRFKKIIDWGKEQINHPVNVINGVEDVLKSLNNQYRLMIITKGDLFDQESKIARSGLAKYFDLIEVVSEKDEATYSALIEKHNLKANELLMVGNSLKSDILPIVKLGAKAIHIPFHTTWIHEEIESNDLNNSNYITTNKIIDILDILNK
jgi:putative hydrolase of the HAD superfamily